MVRDFDHVNVWKLKRAVISEVAGLTSPHQYLGLTAPISRQLPHYAVHCAVFPREYLQEYPMSDNKDSRSNSYPTFWPGLLPLYNYYKGFGRFPTDHNTHHVYIARGTNLSLHFLQTHIFVTRLEYKFCTLSSYWRSYMSKLCVCRIFKGVGHTYSIIACEQPPQGA